MECGRVSREVSNFGIPTRDEWGSPTMGRDIVGGEGSRCVVHQKRKKKKARMMIVQSTPYKNPRQNAVFTRIS
jgi:hypothetical protein